MLLILALFHTTNNTEKVDGNRLIDFQIQSEVNRYRHFSKSPQAFKNQASLKK